MKKKKVLFLLPVIVFACFFIPFDKQKTINIHYPYYMVFEQLKPSSWEKWQPDLVAIAKVDPINIKLEKKGSGFAINAPGLVIDIKTADGFAFAIQKIKNGKSSNYNYVVLPDKADGSAAITLSKNTSLSGMLIGWLGRDTIDDISYLKNYMNDAKAYYGFNIEKTSVVDTNLVVQRKTVGTKNKQAEIIKIERELHEFVKWKQLKVVQPVIADIRKLSADSVQVMIGIPVNKQFTGDDKFLYMHLPKNGKMLTANYKGKYEGRQALYTAMRKYIADHALSSPELPYEKFLDNKIPLSDTALVNMQVNYPVF